MHRNINSLVGYKVEATDGEMGKVEEFYFDDQTWVIRYLIVKTGNWLSDRKVLISPVALIKETGRFGGFPVNLTMDQVRKSPNIDTDKPVYRQQETELHQYYPWQMPPTDEQIVGKADRNDKRSGDDLHLRSTHAILGYDIETTDGDMGHLKDFIIDDATWKIEYLVIEMRAWPIGKKVLLACKHVRWM